MKTTSKKTLLKRGIAVLLAFSLIFTMQGVMNLSVEAGTESDVTTETVVQETVLFESDFDNVTSYDGYTSSGGWTTAWYPELSNQVHPKKNGENGYLSHTQGDKTLGVIRLGHDYKSKTMDYNYVKVAPGNTYTIEYDMYVYANQFAIDNNKLSEGWPLNNDVRIGIAVGNATKSVQGIEYSNYIDDAHTYTSYYQYFETIEKDSEYDTKIVDGNVDGWVHRKIEFTVPADCDVTTHDALQMFVTNGSRCEIRFDNVKVTTTELVTHEVLFKCDFSAAQSVSDQNTNFKKLSNNLYPTSEVTEDGGINKYLNYCQDYAAIGIVRLGHDYSTDNYDNINYIKVNPGDTYIIDFDMRLWPNQYGINNNQWPTSNINIGVAVGGAYLDLSYDTSLQSGVGGQNAYYALTSWYSTPETIATAGSNIYQDWTHKSVQVTIPSDIDVSTYDALQLFATGGQRCDLSIDNIKVTKLGSAIAIPNSDTQISINNYETAEANYQSSNDNGNPLVHYNRDFSGDLRAVYDGSGANYQGNRCLWYRHHEYGLGMVVVGHDYEKATDVTDNWQFANAVKNATRVKAGMSYQVNFDYCILGETGDSDLEIGLAVGKIYDIRGKAEELGLNLNLGKQTDLTGSTFYQNVLDYEIAVTQPKNTAPTVKGWQNCTATITVPVDADLSVYDVLLLYVKNGNQQGTLVSDTSGKSDDMEKIAWNGVLIDNVEATTLAGVGVSYDVDGTVSNDYNSDGNIPYNAMLDANNNAMKWYTDEARTTAFISSDYVRTGVLDTVSLYGLKDTSLAAFVKGDADGDGVVGDLDVREQRLGILGDDVLYPKRADTDDNGALDVRDLVRSKKAMNSIDMTSNVTVGGSALSSYKFVTNVNFTPVVESRISTIESLGHMSDENTNAINVTFNESLADDLYIFEVDQGTVRIEGGSENAIAAALEAVIGYIKAGVSIDAADSMEFIYNGSNFSGDEALIYNENF